MIEQKDFEKKTPKVIEIGGKKLVLNENELSVTDYDKYCEYFRDFSLRLTSLEFDNHLDKAIKEYDNSPSNSLLVHRIHSLREMIRTKPYPTEPVFNIMALFYKFEGEESFDQNTHSQKVQLLKAGVTVAGASFFLTSWAEPSKILSVFIPRQKKA